MLHEPAAQTGKDPAAAYKARVGVWMFAGYALFYSAFVAINLYDPLLMQATVGLGLNLATVYGFALIGVAVVQALIYDMMCRRHERLTSAPSSTEAQ